MINILILPTSYPNIYNENSSIFVQDQAKALSQHKNLHIHVVGAIPISLKDILKNKIFKFGLLKSYNSSVNLELFLFPAIPKLRRLNNFIRYLLNKWLLKKSMKNKIDIVHVHNSVAGEAALWLKEKFNIPYCTTEHSSAYARNLLTSHEINIYKKIYINSVCNIAVSKDLCRLLDGLFDTSFKYIPNIVNTNFFTPSKDIHHHEKFNFVNIANLNRNKNQLLLLQAFSKAFSSNKNVSLSILGDGPEYKSLEKEIRKLNMQNQITLYGFATRNEVLKELKESDAFVLSSDYETFGVVLIEAMSCGLPVISTKCGGPESIILDKNLGLLVEKDSCQDLSKAMSTMYTTKYDKTYIRNYSIQEFSENAVVSKLNTIYEDILCKK